MFSDYIKLVQEWFKIKIVLWDKKSHIVFKQGDIWWCSLGINIGEEMFGKGARFTRPVLVFRKFTSNSFLGLPIKIVTPTFKGGDQWENPKLYL